MVLGAIAIAAGAGDAAMGIMVAGQQAAMGKFMAFTRAQETTADAAARQISPWLGHQRQRVARLLRQASEPGIPPRGLCQGQLRPHPPAFERAHPGPPASLKADPAYNKPVDPALEARFERVKAKLLGFVNPAQAVIKYPESDQSIPAHYARAYAYHLGGYPDKAQAEANALLAADPHDPFFLELKGQILLEGGKPKDAIAAAARSGQRSGDAPMIAAMLGHALVSTEDPKNFTEAKQVLKAAVNRDNQDPFAWYQLGIIYDREGDTARAALATAERSNLQGETKMALASAQMAMKGIPPNTPDWLRAQDIAMVSRTELAKKDKKDRHEKTSEQDKGSSPRRGHRRAASSAAVLALGLLTYAAPDDRRRIVRQGLLADPKILSDTIDALRDAQYAPVLDANRAAIETPFASSWKGAAKPEVTLVEFFDYACPYCKASNPHVDQLLKEDKGLRVVYRELGLRHHGDILRAKIVRRAGRNAAHRHSGAGVGQAWARPLDRCAPPSPARRAPDRPRDRRSRPAGTRRRGPDCRG